jgi:protein CLEC16A
MTVKLFYNQVNIHPIQKYSNFPLIWQAIKFYNHPEALIRNTSKNIILSVAKLDDEKVQKYMRSFPFIVYYSHLAYFIFDTSYKIDKYLNQDKL